MFRSAGSDEVCFSKGERAYAVKGMRDGLWRIEEGERGGRARSTGKWGIQSRGAFEERAREERVIIETGARIIVVPGQSDANIAGFLA